MLEAETAQTGLFEKVKERSYLKKTVDRGLELAETAYRKTRTREYRLGLVKLNLKRLRLKQEVRGVR